MKHTEKGKIFVTKSKGKDIKKLLNSGGREGAKKDFEKILVRASKPLASSR